MRHDGGCRNSVQPGQMRHPAVVPVHMGGMSNDRHRLKRGAGSNLGVCPVEQLRLSFPLFGRTNDDDFVLELCGEPCPVSGTPLPVPCSRAGAENHVVPFDDPLRLVHLVGTGRRLLRNLEELGDVLAVPRSPGGDFVRRLQLQPVVLIDVDVRLSVRTYLQTLAMNALKPRTVPGTQHHLIARLRVTTGRIDGADGITNPHGGGVHEERSFFPGRGCWLGKNLVGVDENIDFLKLRPRSE